SEEQDPPCFMDSSWRLAIARGEQSPQLFPCRGRLGFQAYGRLRCRDAFVDSSLESVGNCQIVVRIGVERLDLHRAPQVVNRVFKLIARPEDYPQVEVRVRILRIEGDRRLELAYRRIGLPHREQA